MRSYHGNGSVLHAVCMYEDTYRYMYGILTLNHLAMTYTATY